MVQTSAMALVRSIIFINLFYLNTLVQMLFWSPVFFIVPRRVNWTIVRLWSYSNLWLQHHIVGTRFDFRGVENIPDTGVLVASKHQSTWETYAKMAYMRDPTYVLKRELMWIPIFGWFAKKVRVIPINRAKRKLALAAMNEEAAAQFAEGRQIVIYPEGTRKRPYSEPDYKSGVGRIYVSIDAPIVPLALNSGLFWPRNGWRLHRGLCILEFLPVIEPGKDLSTVMQQVETAIEAKTNELLIEGQSSEDYDGKRIAVA